MPTATPAKRVKVAVMFEFAWPWMFLLLPLPWLVRYLLPAGSPTLSAIRIPSLNGLSNTQQSMRAKPWMWALLTLCWCLLIAASARPQWLGEPLPVRSEGREIMLAVDLSGSMEIADMQLNDRSVDRLTMVKAVLGDFITRREGDRLGLIFFADTAFLQTPMTYDRETVRQMLEESVLGLVGERTAIGDAIALAVKRFRSKDETNRVLVLLTDGQNTAGNLTPDQALELADAFDVRIYPIAVGAEEVVVDSFFGQRRVNPSRDLDVPLMQRIAETTGGRYFRARSTEELEQIYQLLDELEPIAGSPQQLRPRQALYFWPLSGALLLMVVIALFHYRPWRFRHG
jgi:Ca-activated chloride channel family protein